ncbi:hypothetical protein BJ138DRAFT_1151683 [Hygrophoropsis aurantiaca]|uniref:Uncharacterized protein n=1 Tax=Hygrophoropsis aurantiaca TaxID=72124 RepID=A0ACB8AD74_9AGAM|nr:hypothetical protein BJ138DRAFT_1151683 [Hygrophoropsis aurantiaca]
MLPPPSEMEAKFYYSGLPSAPILIARTSTTPWQMPGLEPYLQLKELRAAGNHALKDVWEDNLAFKVHALLESMKVMWTSTDVVRIVNAGAASSSAPVIIWIGVLPESLSGDDGAVVASKCQALIIENGIADVDVEIRESIVTRLAGPKLFTPAFTSDHTVEVCEPFTATLGMPICAQSTPWAEGTAGFFMVDGVHPERLLLVTAHHVVFPPDKNETNERFECKNDSQPRRNVMLFGDVGFEKHLESIKLMIRDQEYRAQHREVRIGLIMGRNDPAANQERREAQAELDKLRAGMESLSTFYQHIFTHWATPESRILGHVILSPPIKVNVGSEGYTEDWAIIEIDAHKINKSNFNGNAIDLGTRPESEYNHMIHPNNRNAESFKYPGNRLLMLKNTISDEEMRSPTTYDQDNEPCTMVMKRGLTTGLTIGRANNICSYTRFYKGYGIEAAASKEWSILPHDKSSGPFSDIGDSGSVVVDGCGRIGGLLTSGAATTASSKVDITYATPISFILKSMQNHGISKPNINPVLTV